MRIIVFIALFAFLFFSATDAFSQKKRSKKRSKKSSADTVSITKPIENQEEVKETEIDPPDQPQIVFETDTFDFGTANQGTSVSQTFYYKNMGKADLIVTDVKPSCGCTSPFWERESVPYKKSSRIDVNFNTAGKMGPQQKIIVVHTNGEPAIKVLHIIGKIVAPKSPVLEPVIPPQN